MIQPVSQRAEQGFPRGFKTRCENLAIQYRDHLGVAGTAPLCPYRLAEYLGVCIWRLEDVPGLCKEAKRHLASEEGNEWSAVAVRVSGQDIIVLNPSHNYSRQSNDLMHELAHIILDHRPSTMYFAGGVGIRDFNKQQEDEADWLGACLLLPRPALAHHHLKISVEDAALLFKVSPALYVYRLRITGVEKQFQHRVKKSSG